MRILIDLAELEELARLFERNTVELAGITTDLRRRLSTDLLARTAAYGLRTRHIAFECERVSEAMVGHVAELERYTLDLERTWAEAKGLAQDGRLAPGISGSTADLWWFQNASSAGGGAVESHAFAAAAIPASPPVETPAAVTAAAVAYTLDAVSPAQRATTGWAALDVVVAAAGIRHNPPWDRQTYRPDNPRSMHGQQGGHARDYGMLDADAFAVAALLRPLAVERPDLIPELFGADGIGTDEGGVYQPDGHTDDHTHVAVNFGVTAGDLLTALGHPG